jgi:oxygen-independent coproporphyrinogen-3 oxidase
MKASRSFLSDASQPSAYVHVPFCVVKCGYCDFHSLVPSDSGPIDAFLDALERELALAPLAAPPRTAFVGGGTPTFLDDARFERLLRMLVARLRFPDCEEVTIEANPESVTADKLRAARAHGIGRVSIGAQSFDAARLRFLDRPHGADAIRRAVAGGGAAGGTNQSLARL